MRNCHRLWKSSIVLRKKQNSLITPLQRLFYGNEAIPIYNQFSKHQAFHYTMNPVVTQTASAEPEVGSSHQFTNRLIKESSPYLLQHAHNPVDWYPWGEEALEKAKRENKPIFLSIGYSTW